MERMPGRREFVNESLDRLAHPSDNTAALSTVRVTGIIAWIGDEATGEELSNKTGRNSRGI